MLATATTTSAARVAANRQNAARSTGPRTEAGKARSRANAVKHGLAGAGIAVPVEDEAAVTERFLAIQAELAPTTIVGAVLAHQVALMSLRLKRAAIHESAAITARVRQAKADFDQARRDEAATLRAAIEVDPGATQPRLLATLEGLERLLDGWLGLLDDLVGGPEVRWTAEHERRLAAYRGHELGDPAEARAAALSAAVRGDFSGLDPQEYAQIASLDERTDWAINRLTLLIDDEVGRLCQLRQTIDVRSIQRERAEVADLALFDPGRDATLARRYEAAASREFHRALTAFRAVEADAAGTDLGPSPILAPPPPEPSRPVPVPAPEPTPAVGLAREIEHVAELRSKLGSFGYAAPTASCGTSQPVSDAERRQNRPRLDRLAKRNRRRK